MVEREYMRVSKYYYILLGLVCLGMGIFLVFYLDYTDRDYKAAGLNTEIKPVVIEGTEEWGYLRGAVFYNKNNFIHGGTIFISSTCNDSTLSKFHIQKRTLENNDHAPRFYLYELGYPYQLSKKRNTDTIVIKKEDCLLKFLMLGYDGPYK